MENRISLRAVLSCVRKISAVDTEPQPDNPKKQTSQQITSDLEQLKDRRDTHLTSR